MSGFNRPGMPSMGAWLVYGLGSMNNDLPSFVVMHERKPRGADQICDLLVLTGRPLTPDEISGMRMAAGQIDLRLGTWPELYIRTSDEWWRGVYQAAPIRKEIDAEGIDVVHDASRGPA